jgi:hypothetical protein
VWAKNCGTRTQKVVVASASKGLPPDLEAEGLEVCGLVGLAGGDVEVSCSAAGAARTAVVVVGACRDGEEGH